MPTNINFIKSLGIGDETRITLPSLDPATKSYLAATGITGTTQIAAINNLVTGLKADGIWSKMKAVYPFVTDNRNLLSYTEDFSNAYWSINASSVTSNTTIAPNGTTTADTLTENNANNYHTVYVNNFAFANGIGTFSIYVKFNGRKYIILGANNVSLFNAATIFDISLGTIVSTSSGTASITNIGNGWYRCSISGTTTNGNTPLSLTLLDNSLNALYTGNGTSGIYIWGAQYETAALSTYQPIATTQQAYIASQFKYNLVNPVDSDAAFRLVFNGGWTHSSTGATPNGTNGYANTYYNPSLYGQLNSAHLSYYSRTNTNRGDCILGCNDGFGRHYLGQGNSFSAANSALEGNYNPSSYAGFHLIKREDSLQTKQFYNGSVNTTTTAVTTGRPNINMFLSARNSAGNPLNYNVLQCAFSTIGDGLLDSEATALYNRVQNFQLALNRAV